MALREAASPTLSRLLANEMARAFVFSGLVPPAIPASSLVHLLKGSLTLLPDTVLADLTALEADFTGYAAAVIGTWNGASSPISGTLGCFTSVNFLADTPFVQANTVQGYYVTDPGNTNWLLAELFTDPVPIVDRDGWLDLLLWAALVFNPPTA